MSDKLKKALSRYIKKRLKEKQSKGREYNYTLFGAGCGYRCEEKVSAARKLLSELNGEVGVNYSYREIDALNQARLGRITQKYRSVLPAGFSYQEKELEKGREKAMHEDVIYREASRPQFN